MPVRDIRLPVSFRLLALACWTILFPLGSSALLTVGLPVIATGPQRGYHVSHDRDAAGKGARSTPGLRCPYGCVELHSRRLPLSNGQPYTLVLRSISRAFCDGASSRVHFRSPISLSLACCARMVRALLGLNPELRTPRLLATHVRAGTGPWTLARNYTINTSDPPFSAIHSIRATSCRTPPQNRTCLFPSITAQASPKASQVLLISGRCRLRDARAPSFSRSVRNDHVSPRVASGRFMSRPWWRRPSAMLF